MRQAQWTASANGDVNVNESESAKVPGKNQGCVRRTSRAWVGQGQAAGQTCGVRGRASLRVCVRAHVRARGSGCGRVGVTYGGVVGEKTGDCVLGCVDENEEGSGNGVRTSVVGRRGAMAMGSDPVRRVTVNVPWP